jgi:hypothetical protein
VRFLREARCSLPADAALSRRVSFRTAIGFWSATSVRILYNTLKNAANLHLLEREDGNETVFAHGYVSNSRLRSAFGSDKVDACNAAFRCRRGRMDVQEFGVVSDNLRAQLQCPR